MEKGGSGGIRIERKERKQKVIGDQRPESILMIT